MRQICCLTLLTALSIAALAASTVWATSHHAIAVGGGYIHRGMPSVKKGAQR